MQTVFLSGTAPRRIHAAYYNHYFNGALHPSRTMREHDFVYLVSGEWEIIKNCQSFSVKTGDMIILNAGVPHGGVKPCTDGTKTIYIHTSATEEELRGEPAGSGGDPMQFDTVIHCQKNPAVKKIMDQLVKVFAMEDPYRQMRLEALFRLFLLQVHDTGHMHFQGDYIQNSIAMIQNHPQTFYKNEELAAVFFVCPKTFSTHFKRYTGMTPHQYQLKYKLHEVKNILAAQPEIRLRELALDFGFYDEFHLSRAFKKRYGVSPNELRKQPARLPQPPAGG